MKKPGQEMRVEGQRISFSGMPAFEGISGLRRQPCVQRLFFDAESRGEPDECRSPKSGEYENSNTAANDPSGRAFRQDRFPSSAKPISRLIINLERATSNKKSPVCHPGVRLCPRSLLHFTERASIKDLTRASQRDIKHVLFVVD
jgi:hypothetical protein